MPSIVRFFCLTNKRHLLLTGGRGVGKTTLLNQLLPLLTGTPIPGIITWAEPGRGVYLREHTSGQTVPIGVYDPLRSGLENKMSPLPEGFVSLGLSALERGRQGDCDWFSIDEIGYLESGIRDYCEGIWNLMEQKRLVAVLRKQELPFLNVLKNRADVCLIDLDQPIAPLGCVIMASGLGKRFGGNKLMAAWGGSPMLTRILAATEGLFSRRVVVTRHREIAEFCQRQGIAVVLHDFPYRSDTVRLGMDWVGDGVSGCIFCPGDQPLLTGETVQTMALAATHEPEWIWQLSYGDTVGTPVLFPHWCFHMLRHLPEGKGGKVLLKQYPEQVRLVPVRDSYELLDVDVPDDLKKLKDHFKQ